MKLNDKVEPKDWVQIEDEYRKTITQALGSLFVVASIVFAYLQIIDSRKATAEQINTNRRNTDIQLMSSQFAKGFDLLGSALISQRIGGIRLLENWIQHPLVDDGSTEAQRYELIAPALIAFIRQSTAFHRDSSACEDFSRPQSARIPDDVRAAVSVLGPWTHLPSRSALNLDTLNLSEIDLSGFNLDGANLSYSDLSGANLQNTTLHNARLYCTNMWSAKLDGADFSATNGHTVLAGSFMMRIKATGVNFANANMRSVNISETDMVASDFTGTDLFNANFFRSTLKDLKVNESTSVKDACFVETQMSGFSLTEVRYFDDALVIAPLTKIVDQKSHCFMTEKHGLMVPSERFKNEP